METSKMSSEGILRIVLADDQELIRTGLRMVLEGIPGFEVVAEAQDGFEAVAAVERVRPDVILLDVQMPRLDGLEACKRIVNNQALTTKVVMLTTFDLDDYVFRALQNGASGFLLKDAKASSIPAAIMSICAGNSLFAPTITRRLVDTFVAEPSPLAIELVDRLTYREREVLILIAEGLSNGEIAERLYVGEATVKTHVRKILMKLDARDRVQAVITAFRSGLGSRPSATASRQIALLED
jgi:DNA-binding NarL/FixJ family response regulator